MSLYKFMSDTDIADTYRDFVITEAKLWDNRSGGMQIEFPHRESVWDNFIEYADGRIAFDNWYPDDVCMRLIEKAREMLKQRKETQES